MVYDLLVLRRASECIRVHLDKFLDGLDIANIVLVIITVISFFHCKNNFVCRKCKKIILTNIIIQRARLVNKFSFNSFCMKIILREDILYVYLLDEKSELGSYMYM